MPVVFDRSILYDQQFPQTVAGAYRAYGNWSGIHEYNFTNLVSVPSQLVPASGVFVPDATLPTDIELAYTVDGKGYSLHLRRIDSSNYLSVTFSSDDTVQIHEVVAGTPTLVFSQPLTLPTQAQCIVAFRQQRYSEDDNDQWESISVWMNYRLMFSWTQPKKLEDNYTIGLAAGSADRTFTGVTIPQLTEFTEWSSLDPGEYPAGGLQRATEGRYTKQFIRWNGSMRAWRAAVRPVDLAVVSDGIYSKELTRDQRQMASHVRMLGAYVQSDAVRNDLMRKHGYRFIEVNNPYLMSAQASQREAYREIQRLEERFETRTINTDFNPLIEPEDHITIDGESYIVERVSWTVGGTSNVQQELACRKYVLGG